MRGLRGDRLWVWVVRAWWAALPFTAGPVLADRLHETDAAWRTAASVELWVLWGGVLAATLVAHPVTLVIVRLAAPASAAAYLWASFGEASKAEALVGGVCFGLAGLAMTEPVGQVFVNGISYGDEVRLLLRPPALLLMGPVPVAGAVTVGGVVSGPLLLAAEQWVVGAIVLVAGGAVAALGARSLHSLTRRWLVFVPAGVVLHDHMATQDPVLVLRRAVASFGPASPESDALDLSQGASGLILELKTSQPVALSLAARRQAQDGQAEASGILVAPSRPSQALELARQRQLIG